MNLYASIAICFIPLVALTLCLILLVREIKVVHVLLSALLGLLTVIPIALLQMLVERIPLFEAQTLGAVLVHSLIINGLIEETLKMCFLFLLPAKKYDVWKFLFCAMLSGLALGCFESVIYLVSGYENIGLRLVTAVMLHTSCAGLGGIFVWSIKNNRTKILPFIFAIVLHGVYNYFAGFSTSIRWFSIIIIVLAFIECRSQAISVSSDDIK
ncbi:MAG TPA: hypothetical protein DCQ43_00285 [Treponema sp.]|nr:hypothetical protein [Treponema sp.]